MLDRLGIPAMSMQAITDDLLTTEDTWEKIDPKILYEDVRVYMDLCDSIQHVPGKWLRYAEIPGRSFFGCGSLFSDLSMPDYPEGEVYTPEAAQALYTGGVDGPVRTMSSVLKKY